MHGDVTSPIRKDYDRLAEEYARRIAGELQRKSSVILRWPGLERKKLSSETRMLRKWSTRAEGRTCLPGSQIIRAEAQSAHKTSWATLAAFVILSEAKDLFLSIN